MFLYRVPPKMFVLTVRTRTKTPKNSLSLGISSCASLLSKQMRAASHFQHLMILYALHDTLCALLDFLRRASATPGALQGLAQNRSLQVAPC